MASPAIGPPGTIRRVDGLGRRAVDSRRGREANGAAPRDRVTLSRDAQARAGAVRLAPEEERRGAQLQRRDAHQGAEMLKAQQAAQVYGGAKKAGGDDGAKNRGAPRGTTSP